jgi:hypothetical protein
MKLPPLGFRDTACFPKLSMRATSSAPLLLVSMELDLPLPLPPPSILPNILRRLVAPALGE